MSLSKDINLFMNFAGEKCGKINNERALQLELAYYLRVLNYSVTFEKKIDLPRHSLSTAKPKTRLDLLIEKNNQTYALELKVPLNGQHPVTMFNFCKDIEFVEAILGNNITDYGFCLFLTDDNKFWQDSGRGSHIHNLFRKKDHSLSGLIEFPVKPKDSHVFLNGTYYPAKDWQLVTDERLLGDAKYLLLEVRP